MTIVETAQIALMAVSGIGVPTIIFILTRQDRDRERLRQEVGTRLDHLDDCLDKARLLVLERSATREDFNAFRTDMVKALSDTRIELNETMTRMRGAISNETHGLHDRLMRLEAPHFGAADD